jgi:drug/metabolite transporter (DMT)-like permease
MMSRGGIIAAFRAIGKIGLLVATLHALSNISFVAAVTQTSAANVLVIIATAPFFAALLSRIVLDEPIPRRTWVAIGVVIGAVTAVFYGSLQGSGLVGEAIALAGSVASGATITAIRRARGISMIPAMALAALIACIVALGVGAQIPDPSQVGLFVLQGSILLPASIAMISTAPRFIPAPEVSLINRLEMVIGPIWVWSFLGEAPTPAAIASGIIILVTLVVHTAMSIRAAGVALAQA